MQYSSKEILVKMLWISVDGSNGKSLMNMYAFAFIVLLWIHLDDENDSRRTSNSHSQSKLMIMAFPSEKIETMMRNFRMKKKSVSPFPCQDSPTERPYSSQKKRKIVFIYSHFSLFLGFRATSITDSNLAGNRGEKSFVSLADSDNPGMPTRWQCLISTYFLEIASISKCHTITHCQQKAPYRVDQSPWNACNSREEILRKHSTSFTTTIHNFVNGLSD